MTDFDVVPGREVYRTRDGSLHATQTQAEAHLGDIEVVKIPLAYRTRDGSLFATEAAAQFHAVRLDLRETGVPSGVLDLLMGQVAQVKAILDRLP